MKIWAWIKGTLFATLLFFGMLLFAEIMLRLNIKNHFTEQYETLNHEPFFIEEPVGRGKWHRPNFSVRHQENYRGQRLFNVTYNTDKWGRRLTKTNSRRPQKHFILAGCSRVFGFGVEDSETLPTYLGKMLPNYEPYNYGSIAASTLSVLALLERPDFRKQIAQPEGEFVYLFLNSHLARNSGFEFQDWDFYLTPQYRLEHGQLERDGTMASHYPIFSRLMRLLRQSRLVEELSYFQFWPTLFGNSQQSQEIFIQAIARMQELYLSQFPKGHFSVVEYPRQGMPLELKNKLQARGLRVETLPEGDFPVNTETVILPGVDHHARGLMNAKLAQGIRDLLLIE